MISAEDLALVMRTYLSVPETPSRPSMSDWRTARRLLEAQVPPAHLLHAIRIATLRRQFRDRAQPALERVHSLAYYQRALENLEPLDFDPGYIEYVERRFRWLLDDLRENRDPHARFLDQNVAVSDDR